MIDIISSFWKLGVLRKYGYDVWRVEQWYLVQKMRRKQKKGCQVLTHHYQLPTYSAQRRVQLQSIGSLFQILGHSINLLVFA
ncbi:hypothetical protein V6N11_070194 [Hibiscus sabdariffa]|uniref:Uncharacterized protein n=1 Tax=Hibiscus sabdariffa TaxID=183260 RepID=A0ABR2QER0_9ROSI